jgi:hypothetical protein
MRGAAISGTITRANTVGLEVQPDGTEGFVLGVYTDEILVAVKLELNLDALIPIPQPEPGQPLAHPARPRQLQGWLFFIHKQEKS